MSIARGVARTVTFGSVTTAGAANTATTPTAYVSKDAGAQVASTNAASHNGNGQWIVALTLTEMTADTVALVAVGAGLVPSYVTIVTEADYTAARAAKIDGIGDAVPILDPEALTGTVVSATTTSVTISVAGSVPTSGQTANAFAATGIPRAVTFTSGVNRSLVAIVTGSSYAGGNLTLTFAPTTGVVDAAAGDTVQID